MIYRIGDASYQKKLGTYRVISYQVKEPIEGTIDVEFEYGDFQNETENIILIRQFHYVTNVEIARRLEKEKEIDLSFSYVKDFNLEKIRGLLGKEIFFESFCGDYACFDGKAIFDHAKFGDGKVTFENAIFGPGDTSFFKTIFSDSDVSFYNVDFQRGSVSFAEAIFGDGTINFEYAIFGHGSTAFTLAKFGKGNVSFDGATFENGQVLFVETDFGEGNVSFEYTNFNTKNVIFDRAKCRLAEIIFDHCNFELGGIRFIKSDFSFSKIIFKKIKFGYGIDMSGTTAEEVCFINCVFDSYDNLNYSFVDRLTLLECIINKTIRLSGAKTLSLKDTINLGLIYCNWEEEKVYYAINQNQDTAKEKKQQFSLLKQNYHKIGSYSAEDKAFVEYMRCRRSGIKSFWSRVLDRLIDMIGAYGTKPGRVANTMLLIWIFFGLVFTLIGTTDGSMMTISERFMNGMYFSAVTFATIGYGDVVPVFLSTKILAPIEGILGLFLMSYFTVAVVRKTLR